MAQSIDWEGTNLTLKPPEGVSEEQCKSMRVFYNGACFVSCWEPSPAELAEIIRTGQVFASQWGGPPPLFIGSESAVHALVADFGPVWKIRQVEPKLKNDPRTVARLLRAMATGDRHRQDNSNIILELAADMLSPKE